jgi:transcriptional regulator with XRE-family HTH domain
VATISKPDVLVNDQSCALLGAPPNKGLSDTVGSRLQIIRKQRGLSQRELARRADVTNSTLSMIEQGKVSPSVGSLEKILSAFPMSLQEFFSDAVRESATVCAASDFIRVDAGDVVFRVMPITSSRRRGLFLAEQTYAPGAVISSQWMANGDFVGGLVVKGKVELHLDGVVHALVSGDGFNFSLHRDYVFKNTSEIHCTLVCVSFSEKV